MHWLLSLVGSSVRSFRPLSLEAWPGLVRNITVTAKDCTYTVCSLWTRNRSGHVSQRRGEKLAAAKLNAMIRRVERSTTARNM